jgi:outer membrane murein-binding lipoprotein Lpp
MPDISGEVTNIEQTRQALNDIHAQASEFVSTVDALSASLQAADLDTQTLGEVADIVDAAQNVQATAGAAVQGLNARHGQLEEAVNATPHAAITDFYRG